MMPRGQEPAPATQEQVARYGHIAATLRNAMETRGWKMADLNKALGLKANSTNAYGWLNCRGAPSAESAQMLSKLFSMPVENFAPRVTGGNGKAPAKRAIEPFRGGPVAVAVAPTASRVLAFTVLSDGSAKISMDVTLPLTKATPLLRMLLDAGLVMDGQNEFERPVDNS